MKETFKAIPGYPKYCISNHGRVKSLKYNNEKILKPFKRGSRLRYLAVNLSTDGIKFIEYVHVLMFRIFCKDKDFYQHYGVSLTGVTRAVFNIIFKQFFNQMVRNIRL